jgi:hypothetical protein
MQAVELLRMHFVEDKAAVDQSIDHRTVRRLDPYRDGVFRAEDRR